MTADEITRSEALTALAYTPFVVICAIAITVAIAYTMHVERLRRVERERDALLGPWRDRAPGEFR